MKRIILLSAILSSSVLAHAQLVINEIDYDQQSTDSEEYVEILNTALGPMSLASVSVIMYNGSSGSPVEYRNISNALWPDLAAMDFFVICANAAATANCDHVATPATNLIQNGPTDAVALVSTEAPIPLVLDVVSYGGTLAGMSEGTGTSAEDTNDSPGVSIGRFPDGQDTDENDADFHLMCSTPGGPNLIDPQQCDLSTGVHASVQAASTFILLPAPDGRHILVFDANVKAEALALDLFDAKGSLLASRATSNALRSSWSIDAGDLRGQLLIVRLSTPTRLETRRFVLP